MSSSRGEGFREAAAGLAQSAKRTDRGPTLFASRSPRLPGLLNSSVTRIVFAGGSEESMLNEGSFEIARNSRQGISSAEHPRKETIDSYGPFYSNETWKSLVPRDEIGR